MNTKDRKEKQLTLIEFNEEQQAFNFNEDGQTPPREGWMPIAWMQHDEAARWTKTARERVINNRLLPPKTGKIRTEEVIAAAFETIYNAGADFAREMEETIPKDIYLVGNVCDEGGFDVEAAFRDELTAYHYMDCEGYDCVEQVTLQSSYENHKQRTYFIRLTDGQYYHEVKDNINVVKAIGDFKEKDVKQAVCWRKTKEGRLQMEAYLTGSHRYQIFKNAEKMLAFYQADDYKMEQWYELPSRRELNIRELTDFERRIYDNILSGSSEDPDRQFRGIMDCIKEEFVQHKHLE